MSKIQEFKFRNGPITIAAKMTTNIYFTKELGGSLVGVYGMARGMEIRALNFKFRSLEFGEKRSFWNFRDFPRNFGL